MLPAPTELWQHPHELTFSLWFRPTASFSGYGRNAYIINLFDSLKLRVDTSDKIKLILVDGASELEPTYALGGEDVVTIGDWNFVTFAYWEFKLAPSQGMVNLLLSRSPAWNSPVQQSGTGNHPKPASMTFVPVINLGQNTHNSPESFDGLLKEV